MASHVPPPSHKQSLRRSFSEIHYERARFNDSLPCSTPVSNPASGCVGSSDSNTEMYQDRPRRRNSHSGAVRRENRLPHTLREILETDLSDIHHHRPSSGASLPCTTPVSNRSSDHINGSDSHEEVHQYSLPRRGFHSMAIPSRSRLPCNRRGSLDANTPPPSNPAVRHLPPIQELPTPPFQAPSFPQRSTVKEQPVKLQHKGFRRDYALGETLRSQSHMTTQTTPERALQAVSSLEKYDFAFIRRSDGSFSYATLAYRSMEPIKRSKNSTTVEECMSFVMCLHGTTKRVPKRFWGDFVRLVCVPALDVPSLDEHAASTSRENNPPILRQEVGADDHPLNLPGMIMFNADGFEDECSLMSSVSDRVRSRGRGRLS